MLAFVAPVSHGLATVAPRAGTLVTWPNGERDANGTWTMDPASVHRITAMPATAARPRYSLAFHMLFDEAQPVPSMPATAPRAS